MNVYVIERTDRYSWCENYKAVVVEQDILCAERKARIEIDGFQTAPLKITEIDLNYPRILSVENTGA